MLEMKNSEKSIYVMISQTPTRIGKLIRKFGKTHYNHVSVSLDEQLNELYAFARPQHNAILLARLVHENTFRYTLGKSEEIPVIIYKIDVTSEQHKQVEKTIREIEEDESYLYNLLSVLTYPIFKGIKIEKSFTCIEFVMYLLQETGMEIPQPLYKYKPDDMQVLLKGLEIFEGNLLEYKPCDGKDESYYGAFTVEMGISSIGVVKKLIIRSVRRNGTVHQSIRQWRQRFN